MIPQGPGRALRESRNIRNVRQRGLFDAALDHHRAGDAAKASELYRKILNREPRNADAMHMLGLAAFELGHSERARQLIAKAMALAPANALLPFTLGEILQAQGRAEDAVNFYRKALEIEPGFVAAVTSLGGAHKSLGQWDLAAACHARAVELAPDSAEVLSNYGLALNEAGQTVAAIAVLADAAARAPAHPEIQFNLGNILLAARRLSEAEAALKTALAHDPGHQRAMLNLGVALREQGRGGEAATVLRQAIAIRPDFADAHWNLALALLMDGKFAEGWREYEWRRQIPGFAVRRVPGPDWDGTPLERRTLLIHAEQGLGDAIQFARYARLAEQSGGRAVLALPAPLVPLFSHSGICGAVAAGAEAAGAYDVQAPLMSLPHLIDPMLERAGALVPYLQAEPGLARRWAERLAAKPGLKIGICWQGNPAYRADAGRSIAVQEFAPLTEIPGVRLISLQKGWGREQLAGSGLAIEDLGPDFDHTSGAFMDSAAVIANLDLVVCSDSAIAHLAGAMGRAVWVALGHTPDWRWGRAGEACLWYPSMRLFRQSAPGDWAGVFAAIAAAARGRVP